MELRKIWIQLIKDISSLGSLPGYAFVACLLLLLGNFDIFVELFWGIIIACGIIVVLRLIFFIPRPERENYNNVLEKIAASSFPSHHSANAALIFVLVSFEYLSLMLTIFLFLASVLVAISRIYLKKHYFVDVVIGYAIGILVGLILIK